MHEHTAHRIVPVSPATWPALAELFRAGGDPKWCWCQFWRKPGSNWTNTRPEANRADLERLARETPAPGLVAMREGRAVGWVGLGPKEAFPRFGRSRTIPDLGGEAVWSINCFVVARSERRTGVASSLLEAAVEYAGAHGAGILEGIPVRSDPASRISAASVYTGTLGMFERAGFEVAAETTSRAGPGPRRVVVRRTP